MSTTRFWDADVMSRWQLALDQEPNENECAYLYNDIGPLLYVFNELKTLDVRVAESIDQS